SDFLSIMEKYSADEQCRADGEDQFYVFRDQFWYRFSWRFWFFFDHRLHYRWSDNDLDRSCHNRFCLDYRRFLNESYWRWGRRKIAGNNGFQCRQIYHRVRLLRPRLYKQYRRWWWDCFYGGNNYRWEGADRIGYSNNPDLVMLY